jgi:hypothetical protein
VNRRPLLALLTLMNGSSDLVSLSENLGSSAAMVSPRASARLVARRSLRSRNAGVDNVVADHQS